MIFGSGHPRRFERARGMSAVTPIAAEFRHRSARRASRNILLVSFDAEPYLARKYDAARSWLPDEPAMSDQTMLGIPAYH
jgi:hypothetical protein